MGRIKLLKTPKGAGHDNKHFNTMNPSQKVIGDQELEAIVSTGDPRMVAKYFSRFSSCTFYTKKDRIRPSLYASRQQNWVNESVAGKAHWAKDTEMVVAARELKRGSPEHQKLCEDIQKHRETWYEKFGVYMKEERRMAKSLELKRFLKRHRHRFPCFRP